MTRFKKLPVETFPERLRKAADLVLITHPEIDREDVVRILTEAFTTRESIGFFIADWCRFTYSKTFTPRTDVWKAYLNWCKVNNYTPSGKCVVYGVIMSYGVKRKRIGNIHAFEGIVLIRRV